MQEKWLHLVDTARGNEDKVENGEKSQLQGESTISDLPEGKSTEKGGEDMKNHLVPHIILNKGQLFIVGLGISIASYR